MKKLSPSAIKIASITGIFLGAFALSVLADATSWAEPSCAPPNCNTPAPINVGTLPQNKTGPLSVFTSLLPRTGFALDVNGVGSFTGLLVGGAVLTNELNVGGTIKDKTGWNVDGYVLTNQGNGNAEWEQPYIPQTQAVSCTSVNNTSIIPLSGNNSGNNSSLLVKLGTLPAGTYTISGSGISTYNSGGGGAAGVFLDSSPSLTTASDLGSKLPYLVGATTGGTDASYRIYYKIDYANTVWMLKRNGSNDVSNSSLSNTEFVLSETKYIYAYLSQAAIGGNLSIAGAQSICSGGTTASGGNYHYFTPVKSTVPVGATTASSVNDGDIGAGLAWSTISYPATSVIPTTAKSIVVRAFIRSNGGASAQMYIRDGSGFPEQTIVDSIVNPNLVGSDSAIINIPYSSDRQFEATTACWSPNNLCGTATERFIYIIGYTD